MLKSFPAFSITVNTVEGTSWTGEKHAVILYFANFCGEWLFLDCKTLRLPSNSLYSDVVVNKILRNLNNVKKSEKETNTAAQDRPSPCLSQHFVAPCFEPLLVESCTCKASVEMKLLLHKPVLHKRKKWTHFFREIRTLKAWWRHFSHFFICYYFLACLVAGLVVSHNILHFI